MICLEFQAKLHVINSMISAMAVRRKYQPTLSELSAWEIRSCPPFTSWWWSITCHRRMMHVINDKCESFIQTLDNVNLYRKNRVEHVLHHRVFGPLHFGLLNPTSFLGISDYLFLLLMSIIYKLSYTKFYNVGYFSMMKFLHAE